MSFSESAPDDMKSPTQSQAAPERPASFWQRRVVQPVVAQLKQGVSPNKIALTIALGLVLGVFPILGSTMFLCGIAASGLRLNQPIIQITNYFAYPFQLALIIPFYRSGEVLFGRQPVPLSIPLIFARFRADFWQFLRDYGRIAVDGIVVWLILAPFAIAALYYAARGPLRLLSRGSSLSS